MKTYEKKLVKDENPTVSGWYDTDKGELHYNTLIGWYNTIPTYWYKEVVVDNEVQIQKLIEDAVWREYGQKLDDMRRQSDGGVTANYMIKVVKAVSESALKECIKIYSAKPKVVDNVKSADFEETVNSIFDNLKFQKKPFIDANIRKVINLWNNEEISFNKMTEIFNSIASQFQANSYRELLVALQNIEKICDNQNPSHEQIWRIAYGALKSLSSTEVNKTFYCGAEQDGIEERCKTQCKDCVTPK